MYLEKDNFLTALSQFLENLMLNEGLTQEQLEHKSGISQATFSKILAKDYLDYPKLRVLLLLADFVGLKPSEFFKIIEDYLFLGEENNEKVKLHRKIISEVPLLDEEQAFAVGHAAINHCQHIKQIQEAESYRLG